MKKRHSMLWRLRLWSIALRNPLFTSYGSHELTAANISFGGITPDPHRTPDVILAACDDAYFTKFGIAFVRSIDRASLFGAGVHLHLLEPWLQTLREVEKLGSECGSINLTYTVDPCVAAEHLRYRNLYYNAARFLLAPRLLKEGVRRLLILDIDSVMNRTPWPLLDAHSLGDAAIIRRPEKRNAWNKVLAAAVVYSSKLSSYRFADAFARSVIMALRKNPQYHVDQILPHYLTGMTNYEIVDVPKGLLSYEQSPGASFWTAKGAGKHDPSFLTLIKGSA